MNFPKILKNKFIAIFLIAVLLIAFAVFIMKIFETINPKVKIETSKGDIIIELYPDKAPITVENFLNYVNDGFYNDLVFHRIISGFMIQGGGFDILGKEKQTKPPIKLESNNGLKNEKYTIAMARTNIPDSATSQFFVNANNNDFLNKQPGVDGYAVFGKVISGQNIINEIEKSSTTIKNGMPDWPVEDIIIKKISVV